MALAHIERSQPGRDDLSQWLRWEALRLDLLNELHRPQAVLTRMAELPPELPPEFLQQAHWQAAEAALTLGQAPAARDYLSRLLWQSDLSPEQYKAARWLVIESYLSETRVAEAYPLMLRYSQEFAPLAPAEAATFSRELLKRGAGAETGTWVLALERGSPLRLLVELKSGLTSPEQALAAARAALTPAPAVHAAKKSARGARKAATVAPARRALSPSEIAGYWTVIFQAAVLEKDGLQLAEAREHLLNVREPPEGGLSTVSAEELWQSYSSLAEERANRANLLQGDDMAWFMLADGQAQTSPIVARSLFAYLALQARTEQVRANAQLRLLGSLTEAKLGLTAVRLFAGNGRFPEAKGLSPQARAMLGEQAAQNGRLHQAAVYWHGLDTPSEGVAADDWQLKRARLFASVGAYADLSEAMHLLLTGKTAPSPALVKAVMEIAQGLQEADKAALARELLGEVLPLAEAAERRTILFRLGELAEQGNDAQAAADYYLRAAKLADKPDAQALRARYLGARNLARAGLQEDARRQYQLLLRSSGDADLQAAARHALARMP